jgi:hypothetical protein
MIQILTGAQIPMSQLRNDAVDNMMGALTIAGHYIIPGICALIKSPSLSELMALYRMLRLLQPYPVPR